MADIKDVINDRWETYRVSVEWNLIDWRKNMLWPFLERQKLCFYGYASGAWKLVDEHGDQVHLYEDPVPEDYEGEQAIASVLYMDIPGLGVSVGEFLATLDG